MTALQHFNPADRLLAFAFAALTAATLVVAAEAHAFCSIFCIHGDRAVEAEICAGRS